MPVTCQNLFCAEDAYRCGDGWGGSEYINESPPFLSNVQIYILFLE